MEETCSPKSDLTRLAWGHYRTLDPTATARIGEALGSLLEPGDVVVLTGDLGAGKTCLTGGVACGLGDGSAVTSPTFAIMAVHDGGRIPLYHFDLYRLEDAGQLEDTGIYDMLDGDGACLVEWGDLFSDELGDERLDLALLRDPGADPAARRAPTHRGAASPGRAGPATGGCFGCASVLLDRSPCPAPQRRSSARENPCPQAPLRIP